MDTNSLEAVPSEPLITVEPAPSGHRGADWAHAQRFASHPVAPPGRCPHRVQVRDLKAFSKIVFFSAVPMIYGSALLSFAGLIVGILMAGAGLNEAEPALLVIGPILVVVAAVTGFGLAVCLRVWRSLHRPGRLVCVCNTITSAMFLALAAILVVGGGPALLLLVAVPHMAVMVVLWYFRAVLYDPGTCGFHPWLPVRIQQLVKA